MIRSFLLSMAFFLIFVSPQTVDATIAVEFRTAAFIPCNDTFREIYGDVYPSYQIEASYQFCNCFALWANIDEFYNCGHVDYCGSSNINILTSSFGPKYVYPLWQCIDVYAGVGLSVAWSRIHNKCSTTLTKEYDTSVGLAVKSGINYYFYRQFFLDVFVDYFYQPAFHNNIDIGGIRTGLGLGYSF